MNVVSRICVTCDGIGDVLGEAEEFDLCEVCTGSGRVDVALSPAEWEALQRKKWLRGLLLLLLTLIPIVAVASAIFTRDPQYVCGSTWYGMVFIALALFV